MEGKKTKKVNKVSAKKKKQIISSVFMVLFIAAYIYFTNEAEKENAQQSADTGNIISINADQSGAEGITYESFAYTDVPEYTGSKAVEINGNVPFFTYEELQSAKERVYFEDYGAFDNLGRCTAACACLGRETMPASGEKRGDISSIHPSGWHQRKYDCVYDNTIMTRSHLIAWMLSAENDNEKNLISGTRYMNSDCMTEYEKKVQSFLYDYAPMHVLYRVTPVYSGNELVARGVLMEAKSVEDNGLLLQYCVYIHNVQPGIKLNYSNGYSDYTGIFFDIASSSVVTDDIDLDAYKIEMDTHTCHNVDCRMSGDAIIFAGDTSMVSKWTELGYKTCSCLENEIYANAA